MGASSRSHAMAKQGVLRRQWGSPPGHRGWHGAGTVAADAPNQAAGAGTAAPASSERIRWVQYTLNGLLGTNLPTDGIASPDLRAALQDFQAQQGLPASGFVGPDTIDALRNATNQPGSEFEFESGSAPAGVAATDAALGDAHAAQQGGVALHKLANAPTTRLLRPLPNCNCPRCRAVAAELEAETSKSADQEEFELAMELLNVQNEEELDRFLGDIVKSVGRGLKAVGSFATKHVMPVLGPALKTIAKTALPIAGGALGSFIPIPGVGTALGSALGGMVANALEMEVGSLEPEVADIERARHFVRLAKAAIRDATLALGSGPPETVARDALVKATAKQLPATIPALKATLPATTATPHAPAGAVPDGDQQGSWQRQGPEIVVQGL
jgi:hypothetical protein